ncbi:fluoride efflux transporter CrcB [Microvirga splendida]|uniref:Fluoride-specific ion channel FluC n=1 Tax=Microvirga splendida TaxID=2795727 RepID=A0ABS0XY66_9HYPH|nr:fluoride efflux transporter CrcB [Microvirga splendida]MBJ6124990.1 fluoride efflux transporter CrcB [Microvirga splendida]
MLSYLLVFLGAGIGGALRHGVNLGCARLCGTAFPWGTLTVNAVGSFLMGAVAAWLAFRAGEGWSQPLRLFLTTGILGGFTTFSAFSLDAVLIWERGQTGLAVAYVGASVILSIAGLLAGLALIRALTA